MQTKLIAAVALVVGLAAAPARAQAFIVPYVGANFGGNSQCQSLNGCADKTSNLGVAFGSWGGVAGFEEDFGYARNFFGKTSDGGSSVLVLMSNLILGMPAGPVRPYVAGGIGLVKAHVDFTVSSLASANDNNLGYDLGGGLLLLFGHVGVRGDLRRFSTFSDLSFPGLAALNGEPLHFWRATGGLALGF